MAEKNLAGLFAGSKVEVRGSLELAVTGIQYDSRQVKPGNVFVCIPGRHADGHDSASRAVDLGASALVVERWLDLPVTQIKVPASRPSLGLLAAAFFDWPADALRICGVTGTNGKTTVTHLIEHILNKSGRRAGLVGTLGARIGEWEFVGSRTTPEASDLQRLLAEMVKRQVDYAVMEVSSHALDLHRVAGCEYDVAVFTNLTQDHLDFHHTMEQYLRAKAKLFAGLGRDSRKQGPKYAVINADDPAAGDLLEAVKTRSFTYAVKNQADYRATGIVNTAAGVEFDVSYSGGQTKLKLKTPGMFTVYNALAAFGVGVAEGLKPQFLAEALGEIKGVAGRFEPVNSTQPFTVVVDYAHTPDGLENVLKTAREFTFGNIIAVFGCGGDRDRSKRPLMGEIAAKLADYVVVTADNPRTEDPLEIIADIEAGIKRVTGSYKVVPERKEAIFLACSRAKPGDIVIIAGKGHEDYQEIMGRKFPFDDRVVAAECLGRLGYGKTEFTTSC